MDFYNCRQISWSELPPELLSSIAERLENRADIINFRRVCKTWLTSAPFSLLTSRNILSHLFPYSLSDESIESYTKTLVANSTFLVKSAVNPKLPPFIFTADELYPGKLSIRVPLFRYIVDIRGIFPYELSLSRFEILELGRFYTFKVVYFANDLLNCENKVVLLVNPNYETSHLTIDDCTVVELSNNVALAVKRVKSGENFKVHFKGRMFDDIVDFKGRVYAVDRKGRVCYMDYHSLKMFSIVEDPLCEGSGSDNKKRLAVSGGELYLIYRWCMKRGGAFEVFKLNEEEEKWDKLEGIGNDRILFVTYDGCFFASTKDFPQWRGNCIVFPRGSFPQYSGFTTLDDKIFIQLSPYDDDE